MVALAACTLWSVTLKCGSAGAADPPCAAAGAAAAAAGAAVCEPNVAKSSVSASNQGSFALSGTAKQATSFPAARRGS